MKRESAGLLMYRMPRETLEVLLVHPGGPFWKSKDLGAWSIPKGEIEPGENPLDAARREFEEELGSKATGPFLPLGSVKQKAGKIVHAWACRGDCDPSSVRSNVMKIEWPPKSGKEMEIPEIDRAEFFALSEAAKKNQSGANCFSGRFEKSDPLIPGAISTGESVRLVAQDAITQSCATSNFQPRPFQMNYRSACKWR